jgi:dTMP kinase
VVRSILIYSWQKYDCIIFVRYLMGTAYLPSPFDKMAYYFFASTVPTSEFMFFLDVRPEDAERRIRQTRSQFEMFENLEQLRKIRRKALMLASLGKWRIIDAGKSIAEVEMEIATALQP